VELVELVPALLRIWLTAALSVALRVTVKPVVLLAVMAPVSVRV